jgi:hypothetical protein
LLSKDNSPEDLTVEIARVDGGSGYPAVPEDVVASTIRPASIFPPGSNTLRLVDIVFDTPASVVAGEHYALILKARGNPFLPDWYTIGSTGDTFLGGGDTYTGGSASINGVRSGSYPEAGAIHLQRNGRPPMALGDPI